VLLVSLWEIYSENVGGEDVNEERAQERNMNVLVK
jgi:hypothetical protein